MFVWHNNNIMRVYAVKYVWYYVPCAPEERSGAIKTLYQFMKWHLKMIDANSMITFILILSILNSFLNDLVLASTSMISFWRDFILAKEKHEREKITLTKI